MEPTCARATVEPLTVVDQDAHGRLPAIAEGDQLAGEAFRRRRSPRDRRAQACRPLAEIGDLEACEARICGVTWIIRSGHSTCINITRSATVAPAGAFGPRLEATVDATGLGNVPREG